MITRPSRWMECVGNWPFRSKSSRSLSASKSAYVQGNALDAKLSSPRAGVSSEAAKTLRKRIAELTGNIEDASIGLSGGSYADAVPSVKGVTSFSRINGQASALLGMVESTSDQAPVPSLYRTYSDLCRDFNATLAAFQSLQAKATGLNSGQDISSAAATANSSGSLQACEAKPSH